MSSTFKRRSKSSEIVVPTVPLMNSPTTTLSSSELVEKPATVPDNNNNNNDYYNISFPGTKPWTNGISLTSTGLRELDNVLTTPGQPIGTCIWIEEDRWTNDLALCITKYWCAEVS